MTSTALAERFSRGSLEFTSSPLYRELANVVAGDAELLGIASSCRRGQSPHLLFLAAVHSLVLQRPGHVLERYYASVGGTQPAADAGPAFRDFCLEHRAQVEALVSTRLVQTSVVKRSMLLRIALAEIARETDEVALLEVGASAGLNLSFDRYRMEL